MNTLSVRQAADYIGRSVKTLQRLDRIGRLVPSRSATNRRQYTLEQLEAFLGRPRRGPRATVIYCRVSTAAQKPDLANQRSHLEQFCAAQGIANVEFVEETAGGLNFKRKRFLEIMDRICCGSVERLIVAHKDRLCRFAFEWVEHLCRTHECELLIVNSEKASPEQELVQDLMTIVHCFSSRLYGLRNYRKAIREAVRADVSAQDQA